MQIVCKTAPSDKCQSVAPDWPAHLLSDTATKSAFLTDLSADNVDPTSDYTDTLADLELHYPHTLEDLFSHDGPRNMSSDQLIIRGVL